MNHLESISSTERFQEIHTAAPTASLAADVETGNLLLLLLLLLYYGKTDTPAKPP